MEVPAETLRAAMEVPEVNRLMTSTVSERLQRTNQPDLPRLASMDRSALRQLRTKALFVDPIAFGVHGRLRTPRHRPGRARWTATRRLLNDGRRSMSRMRRGEPVPLSLVRVLQDIAHAARRGLGHLSGVRIRKPGRLPLLRLLRDRARPSSRPDENPKRRRSPGTDRPRATPVSMVGRPMVAVADALRAIARVRHSGWVWPAAAQRGRLRACSRRLAVIGLRASCRV